MQLRDYQLDLKTGLYRSWSEGNTNVVLVSPTGSGKTVVMADIAKDQTKPGVAIAHRAELVGQISMALARHGVPHNIIGSSSTLSFCIQQQIRELGEKMYDPRASVTVASVDTLKARASKLSQWAAQQGWWMVDEAHHLLQKNKWGSAVEMFPRAFGVGVTATPVRADNKSLHVEQGGVFHDMIVGPSMRELINRGSLCDYRIFMPSTSIDLSSVTIGSTGDYSQPSLRNAAHKSKITGDIVSSYLKFAKGLRGITFVVDVEQAEETAKKFNEAGVPAMAVSAKTPDGIRADAVQRLASGKLLQLVNVDLFGEGFDVPAVEVVSMGRPTMSYGLFVQQFGRALRPLKGKSHGIIIDHVENVMKHGLPDAPRQWTLFADRRGSKSKRDDTVTPVTRCLGCFRGYEAFYPKCPFCGFKPEPEGRGRPEQVDGDLIELDPAVLAKMRGEVERIRGEPQIPSGATAVVATSIKKKWRERSEAGVALDNAIAAWAGVHHANGESDSQIQRRFYHRFGMDIMSARALTKTESETLMEKVNNDTC